MKVRKSSNGTECKYNFRLQSLVESCGPEKIMSKNVVKYRKKNYKTRWFLLRWNSQERLQGAERKSKYTLCTTKGNTEGKTAGRALFSPPGCSVCDWGETREKLRRQPYSLPHVVCTTEESPILCHSVCDASQLNQHPSKWGKGANFQVRQWNNHTHSCL